MSYNGNYIMMNVLYIMIFPSLFGELRIITAHDVTPAQRSMEGWVLQGTPKMSVSPARTGFWSRCLRVGPLAFSLLKGAFPVQTGVC